MKLTSDNIAYVNEFIFDNGEITIAVMLKDLCISNARYYRVRKFDELPNSVRTFMLKHEGNLVEEDKINNVQRIHYK